MSEVGLPTASAGLIARKRLRRVVMSDGTIYVLLKNNVSKAWKAMSDVGNEYFEHRESLSTWQWMLYSLIFDD